MTLIGSLVKGELTTWVWLQIEICKWSIVYFRFSFYFFHICLSMIFNSPFLSCSYLIASQLFYCLYTKYSFWRFHICAHGTCCTDVFVENESSQPFHYSFLFIYDLIYFPCLLCIVDINEWNFSFLWNNCGKFYTYTFPFFLIIKFLINDF